MDHGSGGVDALGPQPTGGDELDDESDGDELDGDELDDESDDEIRLWIERAEAELLEAWVRSGPRYARRLEHTARIRDPARDVLTLAARRALPLPRRLKRPLPSVDLPVEARAFLRLVVADRRVLWGWEQRHGYGKAQYLHLLDAVHRLTKRAQAVRRESRAPPELDDEVSNDPSG